MKLNSGVPILMDAPGCILYQAHCVRCQQMARAQVVAGCL
jgi:hypothetical protein